MRYRVQQRGLPFVLVAFCLGSLTLPTNELVCWAKVRGDRELLEQIAVAQVSNRERLLTWEGDVLVETYTRHPGESDDERSAHVYFAWDRQKNSWLYRWTYLKSRLGESDGWQTAGMLLDNTWYSCPFSRPGSNVKQGLVISAGSIPANFGPLGSRFYPMYYFTVRNHNFEQHVRKNWLVNADTDWLSLEIEREVDLVTIKSGNVAIPFATARYVFDLSKGSNLVSLVAKDDQREGRWNIEWEERSGLWVPKTWCYANERHDGTEISRRTVTWQRSVVNEPLAEDTFTLDTLRLVPGALVSDHRVGKSWHYKQEKPEEAKKPVVRSDARRRNVLVIVSLNLLALFVVLGVLVWRRGRLFRR